MTWFRKDPEIKWFEDPDPVQIFKYITEKIDRNETA
jgi:hypothetical protein